MGETLIDELKTSTGLPAELVGAELERLMQAAGLNSASMTLDDLRLILADYLQDVFVECKDDFKK
jgi:hypothetical protein